MFVASEHPDFSILNEHGLNMQAVFDLAALPDAVRDGLAAVPEFSRFRQLILIGHGGTRMWQALQTSEQHDASDPVDSFSVDVVHQWLAAIWPSASFEIVYPVPDRLISLQQIGALAGWHFASPFRIGINREWGSWFAYRVAVLIDFELPMTEPEQWDSPCDDCIEKNCISACPASAVVDEKNMLTRCINYRLEESSSCAKQCLSRLACPVATEHRYSREQMAYHYGQSLRAIQHWQK